MIHVPLPLMDGLELNTDRVRSDPVINKVVKLKKITKLKS
jgi:hypothetical protein